jgi:hypothetical protein
VYHEWLPGGYVSCDGVSGMKMTRLNFLFSPTGLLFYFRILQFMTRMFPEKTHQSYRTF